MIAIVIIAKYYVADLGLEPSRWCCANMPYIAAELSCFVVTALVVAFVIEIVPKLGLIPKLVLTAQVGHL